VILPDDQARGYRASRRATPALPKPSNGEPATTPSAWDVASGREMIAHRERDRIDDWPWCPRTPLVQAYAVRERDGFNLIDTCTVGQDGAVLEVLATVDRQAAGRVRVYEILLTHGHDDHTSSEASFVCRAGRRRGH
jgi:hypothetical protein